MPVEKEPSAKTMSCERAVMNRLSGFWQWVHEPENPDISEEYKLSVQHVENCQKAFCLNIGKKAKRIETSGISFPQVIGTDMWNSFLRWEQDFVDSLNKK